MQDKYWTYGKSVAITADGFLGHSGKTLAVDGRLHNKVPQGDGDNSFSLFWAIPRTVVKKEANLLLQKASADLSVKVTVPGMKKKLESSTKDNEVAVQVLTNPLPIEAHTRLVALEDMTLHKLRQKEAEVAAKGKKK